MPRLFPLCALFLFAAAGVTAESARDKALTDFAVESVKAQQAFDAAMAKARDKAVAALERLAQASARNGDSAELASCWREVLRLDPDHEKARAFFSAVGQLDQVLADITTQTDLLGNPLPAAGSVNGVGPEKDGLVIWNQHHTTYNNYGTKTVNIVFYRDDREVQRLDHVAIDWAANEDKSACFSFPKQEFNRLRVEILTWQGLGGGLAEIQVYKGGKNVADKAKVTASAYWPNEVYVPAKVIDGCTSSAAIGTYWVLPNDTPGWIELDFSGR